MSAWKRGRGWTERHGWGQNALARFIGRQRREARRFRTPEFERMTKERAEWLRSMERQAWEYYQSLPRSAPREEFDAAQRVWAAAHKAIEGSR